MSEEIEVPDDDNPDEPIERKIQIDASPEVAQGVYANLTVSHFNGEEFVMDFVYAQPQSSKGQVRSRVIMHPRNVALLTNMLIKNLESYDEQYGSDDNDPSSGISLSFN
ncbi:DUF3467 domain-containing protein [bacterium]|jgi:hypothetical protein|nr:DUF3467 domain-containing protein [bacterium]